MRGMLPGPLGRLAVQVALGTMIVVLVVGALVILQVDTALQRTEEERFTDHVGRAQGQLASQFAIFQDQVMIGAIWTASLRQVTSAMAAGESTEAMQRIEEAFAAINVATNERIAIALYDAGGGLLLRSREPASIVGGVAAGDPPPEVLMVVDSRQPVRSARHDPALGPSVCASAPLLDADGTFLGVLDLAIGIDERFVADYSTSLGVDVAFVAGGATVVSSAPGRFDNERWPEVPPAELAYLDVGSERYLSTSVPVNGTGGDAVGMFVIGIPETEVRTALEDARTLVYPVVGGGAVLAVLLSFIVAWLTTAPARRLAAAARRIQENELDEPVPVRGAVELRSLAEAMEDMRLAIRSSRETLLNANQELASRVDMSTANLAEVTHQLGVIHRVLAQLDGEPPGGLPGVAAALAELEWTGGAVIALAREEGRLAPAAVSGLSQQAAGELVDVVSGAVGVRPMDGGWYVAATLDHLALSRLADRGIGGFALQPMQTAEGVAGFVAVTSPRRLALTPQREALLHSVAREVALTLVRTELADEVEENRLLAESVLREMSDGVLVLDHEGICRICNPAAARLLGHGWADIVGQHATMYLPLNPAALDGLLQRTPEDPASSIGVVTELDDRLVAISAGLFADPDPARGGVIVMLRDLSAEAEAERVKQDFVSMVGHELRTPLTLIRTTIDLLQEGDAGALNETQERIVAVLRSNSDRLMSLISDLLDMSALDSGRVRIQADLIDLSETVASAVEAARGAGQAKQHVLEVTAPPGIVAWADRSRVEQIVANLVTNAFKYTEPGGEIHVTVREDGDVAEVAVRDNGVGIPPEEQPHLFEKFYRTSSGRRTTGGTGLGLAIARSLVELHGGTIRCESDGRSGSTFAFTLPRNRI